MFPVTTSFRPGTNACLRSGPLSRGVVRADKMCRDMVSTPSEFQTKGETFKVTFLTDDGKGTTIDCPDDQYILEAAEEQNLDLPATCRGGICGACVVRVASGTVDMSDIDDISFTLEPEQVEQGMALICMARACSDLQLETQCDWGLSLGIHDWKGASGKLSATVNPLMGSKSWNEGDEAK